MEKRIKLERIGNEDEFTYFAQLAFNEEVMKMNMGRVFTQDEAEEYFSYILEFNTANKNAGTYKVFCENDTIFIGIGSLWAKEDSTEIEYMVLPEYWGQGYATEIVKSLIEIAKQTSTIKKVIGLVGPFNIPSKKVLTKNGFTFERTYDVEEHNTVVEIYSKLM
jgi:RimJ/RimL family protein N-acetyltransferase